MTTTTKYIASTDGSKIYAEAIGDPAKPALILVPGFSLSTMVFDKQFEDEQLRKKLFLVRYDARGHGQSSRPETPDSYTSKLYADDFKAVCDAFGISKPFFAGWSLAGCIAADILTHLGCEYVSGIIYIGAILAVDRLHDSCTPAIRRILPEILSKDNVPLYKAALAQFIQIVFEPWVPPFQVVCAWRGVSCTQPTSVSNIILTRKSDTEGLVEAGKKGLPVLYLQGTREIVLQATIVDDLKEYYGEKKDAVEVVAVDSGHAFFYEKPEQTNRALLQFITKVANLE